MKASVGPITRDRINELISSQDGDRLTLDQRKMFDEWFSASPELWAGFVDDKLLCVLGLVPPTLLSNQAYLWLYTTEAMEEHKFIFVRYSQLVMTDMRQKYRTIVGHCAVNAKRSQQWLRWLGAEFAQPEGDMISFTIRGTNG